MAQNTTVPRHEDAIVVRQRAYFVEVRGEADAEVRRSEIAGLDSKDWKGRTVYRIRCHGTRGKGPHDCWVPESLLWNLIGLGAYRCVFHAGD